MSVVFLRKPERYLGSNIGCVDWMRGGMYEISAILASLGIDESCSVSDIVNQDKGRSTTDIIIAYLESRCLQSGSFYILIPFVILTA